MSEETNKIEDQQRKKCNHFCNKFDLNNLLRCCICTNDTQICNICLENLSRINRICWKCDKILIHPIPYFFIQPEESKWPFQKADEVCKPCYDECRRLLREEELNNE